MRTAWRILYIIYATILLLVVGSLAQQRQEQLYFESEGQKALASSNELEKFYFFYSSLGYHVKSPVFSYENEDFIISFFEVYRVEKDLPTLYIMLYPQYEGYETNDRVLYEMWFNYGDNKRKTYQFNRFRNLRMYMLVNDNQHAEIPTAAIRELDPYSFTVSKTYAVIDEKTKTVSTNTDTFEIPYTLIDSELIVENKVKEIGFDDEKLNVYGIFPQSYHSMAKYSYIFYLSMTAAIIAIVLGAYFLFFFRRGKKAKLGSGKPTRAFRDFGYQEDEYKDPLLVEEDEEDSN